MESAKRIYCIEGVHDWGDGEVEPSVEPMLQLLQRLGSWDYIHRTCGTMEELKYRLATEWIGYCEKGSVLYFCTHGAEDQIWLRSEEEPFGLMTLREYITDCEGCHIHFGGCNTFSGGQDNLAGLLDYTNATSVSGYSTEADWLGQVAPAIALELLFFGLLYDVNLARNTRDRSSQLRKLHKNMVSRFPDCQFEMLVRRYRR